MLTWELVHKLYDRLTSCVSCLYLPLLIGMLDKITKIRQKLTKYCKCPYDIIENVISSVTVFWYLYRTAYTALLALFLQGLQERLMVLFPQDVLLLSVDNKRLNIRYEVVKNDSMRKTP